MYKKILLISFLLFVAISTLNIKLSHGEKLTATGNNKASMPWILLLLDESSDDDNTLTVGPAGGKLVFPNGVILDIPPGAVWD